MKGNKLWLNVPDWLKEEREWAEVIVTSPTKERQADSNVLRKTTPNVSILQEKFAFCKASRVCAWVRRFINNLQHPDNRCLALLTVDELQQQNKAWVKKILQSFDNEDSKPCLDLRHIRVWRMYSRPLLSNIPACQTSTP